MEIMYLIDRLEALVNSARRVPLTANVVIAEEELLALIEQMRQSVPAEVRQAKRLLQEREDLIKNSQAEADKIVTQAREHAHYMVDTNEIALLARERSEQVLNDAQRDAQSTKLEIEQYAVAVLGNLEQQLESQLSQIRNGLAELDQNGRA